MTEDILTEAFAKVRDSMPATCHEVVEAFIKGPADNTDPLAKAIDATAVTQTAGQVVIREGAVIADPANLNARANVTGEVGQQGVNVGGLPLEVLDRIDHSLEEILTLLRLVVGDVNN